MKNGTWKTNFIGEVWITTRCDQKLQDPLQSVLDGRVHRGSASIALCGRVSASLQQQLDRFHLGLFRILGFVSMCNRTPKLQDRDSALPDAANAAK